MPHADLPCSCPEHDCPRPVAQRNWRRCRSCAVGWHETGDCGSFVPEPWPSTTTCGACGVEKKTHGDTGG